MHEDLSPGNPNNTTSKLTKTNYGTLLIQVVVVFIETSYLIKLACIL